MPLDPNYPSDRLAYILEDSAIHFLLTKEYLIEKLPRTSAKILEINAGDDGINYSSDNLTNLINPDNLAYIIYTSGSTGKPKGVLVSHQGLANLAIAQINAFQVAETSRIFQFASLSFDASISEIFMALCSGAMLYLSPSNLSFKLPDLVELLQEQKITHITLPPSILAALPQADLPTLKQIIVAGENCPLLER